MLHYKTKGVCATEITFEIEDNKVKNVNFIGGCPGNLLGIEKLVEGLTISEIIDRLQGISCGRKSTSCPDQLSKALINYLEQQNKKIS